MPDPRSWPSLADERHLARELFGDRGQALVDTWLELQLSRVDDATFARSFSDHIDLPGVGIDDYLHRRIDTSSGSLLGGIRFYGRDISRPFIEVVTHSFDDIDRLCDCVTHEWSMFAPPYLRLQTRPGRNVHADVLLDKSVYVARYRDIHSPDPGVWLEPFDNVDGAEALVSTRYRDLAADNPALARNVFRANAEDLREWHESGQLHAIRAHEAVVGLIAVAPGRIGWIEGDEINEEVIAVGHQGHGYAALGQRALAEHHSSDSGELLIGTIDRLNVASRKTAEAAGRLRVLDAVFVPLDGGSATS